MRIAQLISARVLNGAARHCLTLSQALAARGHQVTLLYRPELGGLDLPGVRCLPTGFGRRPRELRRVMDLLADVEVIHTHMSSAHTTGALLRLWRGVPTVATAHARHFQLHWLLNDQVIAPSRSTAAYHRRVNRVSAKRLTVIHNFVDAAAITPVSPAARAEARRRLGLDEGALVIGCVADIAANKRQSDLVTAARPLLAGRDDAVLLLMGAALDAGEAERVERAAQGLGARVRRLGRRTDVGEILAGLDIFALSSLTEEAPMAVLEAMAAALPIAATDVGGVAELAPDGLAALLTPPGDPAALGVSLERLAGDPALRQRFGKAARARALAQFAPEPTVDRIEAVLRTAATARPGWARRTRLERRPAA